MKSKYIPFLQRFVGPIIRGEKTMTCRTKKYGKPSDVLITVGGLMLEITEITRMRLGDVAKNHWKEEGCKDEEEFKLVWEYIHPYRGFEPGKWVWVHRFKVRLPEAPQ